MNLTSWPPATSLYVLGVSLVLSSWSGYGPAKGSAIWCFWHGALLLLSYSTYVTWRANLTVFVDGFELKRADLCSPSKPPRPTPLQHITSWPPNSLLGWTPFQSLPFNSGPEPSSNSWSRVRPDSFKVRPVGYSINKQKEPCGFSLYECIGVDIVRAATDDVTSKTPGSVLLENPAAHPTRPSTAWLRTDSNGRSRWSPDLGLPRLILINAQLPDRIPSMWSTQEDDLGLSLIGYFVISDSTIDALRGADSDHLEYRPLVSPAISLLKQLLESGESKPEKVALKVIGQIENLEDLGLPDLIKAYNAKPTLLTKAAPSNPVSILMTRSWR